MAKQKKQTRSLEDWIPSGTPLVEIQSAYHEMILVFENGVQLHAKAVGYEGTRLDVQVSQEEQITKTERVYYEIS
jgi:hypothetical protein